MGIFKNAHSELVKSEMEGNRVISASGIQRVVVEGKDWGPASTKILIELNDEYLQPNTFDETYFKVIEKQPQELERTILKAYVCDKEGYEVSQPSKYIALELYVSPSVGSPVFFDVKSLSGLWLSNYVVETTLTKPIEVNEQLKLTRIFLNKKMDLTNKYQRITPEANRFKFDANEDYQYAYYAPDTKKNSYPLIIWLHGGGEGGDDLYKAIYGNKVVSLISEEFQNHFDGAYVLVPQAKTFWMDGYGTFDAQLHFTPANANSIYTESLMKLIQEFVSKHPIDPKQIIVGGCSNGGYMSMQLLVDYPTYFAAGYQICEGMLDSSISDAQIKALADSKTGVYFIYSKDDNVFNHKELTSLPTYQRLKKANGNTYICEFEEVVETYQGLAAPFEHKYSGHFSWVKFFNNECKNLWEMLASQKRA